MILLPLAHASSIFSLHPLFGAAFDYVLSHDLASMCTHASFGGRVELDGDRFYINIGSNVLVPASDRLIEVHRRYIDIHIPLSGSEIIGYRAYDTLSELDTPYDLARDYAFYRDTPTAYVDVLAGEFLIATPADGHAPLIGSGTLLKAVVKIQI